MPADQDEQAGKEKHGKPSFTTRVKLLVKRGSNGSSKERPTITGEGETVTTEELWNTIGYHRITGGIFYSYILLIGGALVGLVTVGIIAEFLPFPEIHGYRGIVAALLGFWFGLLDLNMGGGGSLSDSMGRFIGQYADTNPLRAMEYIRFYIWFQMMSGVAQVSVISVVCFTYLVHTNFAYLIWFILAQTLVQYPGMLMIMEDTLKAFQRGDKTAWLTWMQDTVFQVTVNIVFLIIGRWWGASNPHIGEIMGITLFYILSQFMDDWINLAIGAKMFSNIMKKRGIDKAFRRLFIPKFDKGVVKQCLVFVGKQWMAREILGVFGYFIGIYIIIRTPLYASWLGLMLIPNFLGQLVSMVNWGSPTVPAISGSFNNDKKELARYFVHDMFKYWIFVVIFMAVPLSLYAGRILDIVLDSGLLGGAGLTNYRAGLVMIPFVMIINASGQWRGWWRRLFVACDDPMPPIWLDYVFTPSGYVLQFVFLHLSVDLAIIPVWTLLLFPGFLNDLGKAVAGWAWFQKRILKINYRRMAWQSFIAPFLTALGYAGVLLVFQYTAWPLLDMLFIAIAGPMWGPVIVAALILLMILFLFPAIFMCPIYALVGGWDAFTLEEFRKTAVISGPSKFLMMMMYKITAFFTRISPLHDKFPIADYEVVNRQAEELVAEGKAFQFMKKR